MNNHEDDSNTPQETCTAVTFPGANGLNEIETDIEFLERVNDELKKGSPVSLSQWILTHVDLSSLPEEITPELWAQLDFSGARFLGCTLPSFVTAGQLRDQGAVVIEEPIADNLPFSVFRSFMYRQNELRAKDDEIYQYYREKTDLWSELMQGVHDFCVKDALLDYLECKTVVAIMGGHGMKRASEAYRNVAVLAWRLAREGFLVATGGGPGAMESANLGAYMFERTREELNQALDILASTDPPAPVQNEYENFAAPEAVIERFGMPSYAPSLGIPTYRYGHEPSNRFATWQAKMFSNALREDGLISIANGGLIYMPGSAGTRQEIFQAACYNHYASEGNETPMIFHDTTFWNESGIFDLLSKLECDRPFAKWLVCTDDTDRILQHLLRYRSQHQLPILSPRELQRRHWERPFRRPSNNQDPETRHTQRQRLKLQSETLFD